MHRIGAELEHLTLLHRDMPVLHDGVSLTLEHGVQLTPRVHPHHRPHAVLVRRARTPARPHDPLHRQLVGPEQRVRLEGDLPTECIVDRGTGANCCAHHVADGSDWVRVGGCASAGRYELVRVEHHEPRLARVDGPCLAVMGSPTWQLGMSSCTAVRASDLADCDRRCVSAGLVGRGGKLGQRRVGEVGGIQAECAGIRGGQALEE